MKKLVASLAVMVIVAAAYGIWYSSLNALEKPCAGFFKVERACVGTGGLSPEVQADMSVLRSNMASEALAASKWVETQNAIAHRSRESDDAAAVENTKAMSQRTAPAMSH